MKRSSTSKATVRQASNTRTRSSTRDSTSRAPLGDITNIINTTTSRQNTRKRKFGGVSQSDNQNNITGASTETGDAESAQKKPLHLSTITTSSNTLHKVSLTSRQLECSLWSFDLPVLPDSESSVLTEVEVLRAPTAAFGVFDFLSQNPRWASQFAAGVETELRRVELEHELSAVYLDNLTQLLGSHREQMVALMLRFARGRNWTQLTLHLAVRLLDRYLSSQVRLDPAGSPVLQLDLDLSEREERGVLVGTMLWMAFKLEEKQVGFQFEWLSSLFPPISQYIGAGATAAVLAMRKANIVRCETQVVQALSYYLTSPTAQSYLCLLAPVADLPHAESFSVAKCLVECSLLAPAMLRFPPSQVACAAICLALALHHEEHPPAESASATLFSPLASTADGSCALQPMWSTALESFTGYSVVSLLPCITALRDALRLETYRRARLYAHHLLQGTDYSYQTLLRTLQHLSGNNTRCAGQSLPPFAFDNISGRISADLQAYHDSLPMILLHLERNVAADLGVLHPFTALQSEEEEVQVAVEAAATVVAMNSLSSLPQQPAAPSSASQTSSSADIFSQSFGRAVHEFKIFGKGGLDSTTAAVGAGSGLVDAENSLLTRESEGSLSYRETSFDMERAPPSTANQSLQQQRGECAALLSRLDSTTTAAIGESSVPYLCAGPLLLSQGDLTELPQQTTAPSLFQLPDHPHLLPPATAYVGKGALHCADSAKDAVFLGAGRAIPPASNATTCVPGYTSSHSDSASSATTACSSTAMVGVYGSGVSTSYAELPQLQYRQASLQFTQESSYCGGIGTQQLQLVVPTQTTRETESAATQQSDFPAGMSHRSQLSDAQVTGLSKSVTAVTLQRSSSLDNNREVVVPETPPRSTAVSLRAANSASAAPVRPVQVLALTEELQQKYQLYPATPAGDALLGHALRHVEGLQERVHDAVRLRYGPLFQKLVTCCPY